jgi:hypothetical protein
MVHEDPPNDGYGRYTTAATAQVYAMRESITSLVARTPLRAKSSSVHARGSATAPGNAFHRLGVRLPLRGVLAEVSPEESGENALCKPPLAADAFEPVDIATSGDGLEGKHVCLLEYGAIAARVCFVTI